MWDLFQMLFWNHPSNINRDGNVFWSYFSVAEIKKCNYRISMSFQVGILMYWFTKCDRCRHGFRVLLQGIPTKLELAAFVELDILQGFVNGKALIA